MMQRINRRSFLVGASIAPLYGLTPTLSALASTNSRTMQLGMCIDVSRSNKASIDKSLNACKNAGVSIVRWDGQWKFVEMRKGVLRVPPLWDYAVDFANSLGIASLIILDYGNPFYENGDKPLHDSSIKAYSNYAQFIVKHFKGRVSHYQIWNEWNGRVGNTAPGNSYTYARLVNSTLPAIKAEDPDCIAIAGGFSYSAFNSLINFGDHSTHFEELLETDALWNVDAISIHPYVVYRGGALATLEAFNNQLGIVLDRIRSKPKLANKPIFITELGWTTSRDGRYGISEELQKVYLIGAIQQARKFGINTMILYGITDGRSGPIEPESNFGILRSDWTAKPIYEALVRKEYDR